MRNVLRVLGFLSNPAFGYFLFVLGYDSSFFLAMLRPRIQLCEHLGCFACLGSYLSPLNRCKLMRGTAPFSCLRSVIGKDLFCLF